MLDTDEDEGVDVGVGGEPEWHDTTSATMYQGDDDDDNEEEARHKTDGRNV